MEWNVHHKSGTTLSWTVMILLLWPKNAKRKHKHVLKGRLNQAQPTEAECQGEPGPPLLQGWVKHVIHHLPYLGWAYLFGMWILPYFITIFKWI